MQRIIMILIVTVCIVPAHARDSGFILFISNRDGEMGLYRMPVDGGAIERVLTESLPDAISNIQLSPDGRWLSFIANNQIYMVNLDEQTLHETEWRGRNVQWSPDSRYFLFTTPDTSLRLVDVMTQTSVQLPPHNHNTDNAQWSVDSSQIVYTANTDFEDNAVYIYAIEQGEGQAVTAPEQNFMFPVWSNDGGRIAVTSDVEFYYYTVYTITLATRDIMPLTDSVALFSRTDYRLIPTRWTSDDRHIILFTTSDGIGCLYQIDSIRGDAEQFVSYCSHAFTYTFAPDNQRLALELGGDGGQQLYVYDTGREDGELYVLPEAFQLTSTPSWSDDSQWLVFTAYETDPDVIDVYRLEVATGELANMTADAALDSVALWLRG